MNRIDNPSPQAYATTGDRIGGRLKAQPDDFLVDEIPLYAPCGEGEHLYLGVQKVNVSHVDMIHALCRTFDVRPGAIGFAGMKDKRAVTRQQISVHLPGREDPPSLEVPNDGIDILWAQRHRNKLRRGHLVGNRFSIRIRDVDPVRAPSVLKALRQLERQGVPSYFGSQRFGYRLNNHKLGAFLLHDEWQAILDELLGSRGSWYPEYQQERRELYDVGRYDEALVQWTRADRSEWLSLQAMVNGAAPKQAVRRIGETTTKFWVSALQSAIFNRVLDERLRAGTMGDLLPGDLAWKHDSRSVFRVGAEDLATTELRERLGRLEVSPSGPLWGPGMLEPEGRTGTVEREMLLESGFEPAELSSFNRWMEGRRRPLRSILKDPAVEGGVDERGGYIKVAFDLPRGIYATIVLREVMGGSDETTQRRSDEVGAEGGRGRRD